MKVNQLVYDIHLARMQHEELKRQESNAQCQVDKVGEQCEQCGRQLSTVY